MTELDHIDIDKLKAEIKRQKEINKMLVAHEEDYIKTLRELQVKIEALQYDNDNLYKAKRDLEDQLIQSGLTEYIGADEIEKETARKILQEIYNRARKNWLYDCWERLGLDELVMQYGVEIEYQGEEDDNQ